MTRWGDRSAEADKVWGQLPTILADWPSDAAPRSQVRAQLPSGSVVHGTLNRNATRMARGGTGNVNVVSKAFNAALARFEKEGLIERRGESIRILNRDGLRGRGDG